ncbi:Acyl-acyl carrier protein thioesterase ATL4 chloroplastic, partial [Bienertia sinuspersici]
SGDKLFLKVRVSKTTTIRFYFETFIYKLPNQELVLEAKAAVVWLGKNYRPVRVPEEVMSKLILFNKKHETSPLMY